MKLLSENQRKTINSIFSFLLCNYLYIEEYVSTTKSQISCKNSVTSFEIIFFDFLTRHKIIRGNTFKNKEGTVVMLLLTTYVVIINRNFQNEIKFIILYTTKFFMNYFLHKLFVTYPISSLYFRSFLISTYISTWVYIC